MFSTMKRLLLLSILMTLKIAVILANSLHSCFLSICKVIFEIFQLPSTNLLNDLPSTENDNIQIVPLSSLKVSNFTQTESVGSKSNTDVIIYNLNSTQELVITQGKINKNRCAECKSEAAISLKKVDVTVQTVSFKDSNCSCMSIESDVLDSKIETVCSSSSNTFNENSSSNTTSECSNPLPTDIEDSDNETLNAENNCKSTSFTFKLNAPNDSLIASSNAPNDSLIASSNAPNDSSNGCNSSLNVGSGNSSVSSNFCNDGLNAFNERLSELDFPGFKGSQDIQIDSNIECDISSLTMQKTSSPFKELFQSLQINLSTNDYQNSQITENKNVELSVNSNFWKNDTLGKDFKRRLSLPIKLNTTNTSLENFKLAQKKLIEEALNNSPRHEKSYKEIKYPFASELSLDSKPNDEEKEVFSCSSYESLPVSDHLRNACDKNTLLNLYNENLHSEDKPDFSCVDHLIESFNDFKSSSLLSNLDQNKINFPAMSKDDKSSRDLGENSPLDPFHKKSSCSQILKDSSQISETSKDTQFGTNTDNKMLPSFSGINSGTSIAYTFKLLDKLLTKESQHISKLFDEDSFKNPLKSEDYFENNELIKRNKEVLSPNTKQSKSTDSLMLEYEGNFDETEPCRTICNSSSLSKSILSDEYEWIDRFENTVISPEGKLDASKSKQRSSYRINQQQNYNKIAFIDDSPSSETSQTIQNTSQAYCQNHFLNEDENLRLIKEKDFEYSLVREEVTSGINSFHGRLSDKIIKECEKMENTRSPVKYESRESSNKFYSDQFEGTSVLKCSRLKDKVKNTSPDLCDEVYQQHSPLEKSLLDQNISATNDRLSNDDQKSVLVEENTSTDFEIDTQLCDKDPRPVDHQPEISCMIQASRELTSTSETNNQEAWCCLRDEKPTLFEENTSSGESTSDDNSVVTVKELSVAED